MAFQTIEIFMYIGVVEKRLCDTAYTTGNVISRNDESHGFSRAFCFVWSVSVVVALVLPAPTDYAHAAVASFGWTPNFHKSHKLITVPVGMEFVLFSYGQEQSHDNLRTPLSITVWGSKRPTRSTSCSLKSCFKSFGMHPKY